MYYIKLLLTNSDDVEKSNASKCDKIVVSDFRNRIKIIVIAEPENTSMSTSAVWRSYST